MAEFRMVANAERSPTNCIACGNHVGPFVDFNSTISQVPTTVGVMDMDIGFYLCVGSPETPGCVVQIARMTGLTVDSTTHDKTVADLKASQARVAELEDHQQLATKLEESIYELYGPLGTGATAVQEPRLRTRKKT